MRIENLGQLFIELEGARVDAAADRSRLHGTGWVASWRDD